MTDSLSRRVLVFCATCVPLFAVSLVLYPQVLGLWQPAAIGAANAVTRQLSPPTWLVEEEGEAGWRGMMRDRAGAERSFSSWAGFVRHFLFLGLAFVPALLLATPAPLHVRLELLALGLLLLFGTEVLSLVGLMRGKLCLVESPGRFTCLWLLRIVYASGQILGLAVWALLAWSFFFPEVEGKSGSASRRVEP